MRDVLPAHPTLYYLITIKISDESTNYEAPHYGVTIKYHIVVVVKDGRHMAFTTCFFVLRSILPLPSG